MTNTPPALLLDLNRLTVEVERLKKERDEWKERYEKIYDAGHNFSVIASVAASELNEARAELEDLKKQLAEAKALVRELYEAKWGKP